MLTLIPLAAAAGPYEVNAGTTLSIGATDLQLNCNALDVRGRVELGTGAISSSGDVNIAGGTLSGGAGRIVSGGSWSNTGTFNAGTGTVSLNGQCSSGPVAVSGTNAFCNLQLGSNKAYTFPSGQVTTVTCNLDLGSGNTVASSSAGTAVISLAPGAVVTGTATLSNAMIGNAQGTVEPVPSSGLLPLLMLMLLVALGAQAALRKQAQPQP